MSLSLFARLKRRYNPTPIEERRRFLQATLALGAGSLLSNQFSFGAQQAKQKRIVVVGAGFAGLACAHELQAAGYKVTVFEARPRVGGRVLSFNDLVEGKNVEGGAELIGENHPTWWAFKEKFKFDFLPLSEDEDYDMPIQLGGKLLDYEEGAKIYEEMEEAFTTLNKPAENIDADQPWKSPRAAEIDKQSIADWLKDVDVSPQVRALAAIQIGSDNSVANEKASLLGMLTAIKGGGVQDYWDKSETHRCAGGNQQLALKLAEAVGPDHLRLKLPVESISYGAGDVVTVVCADGRTVECDDVVLATPPSTWPRIKFNPGLPEMLKPQMGTAVKYLTAVKKRFWQDDKLSQYSVADGAISQTWELTDAQPNEPPTAGLVAFSGGPQAEACLKFKKEERDAKYAAEFSKLYEKFSENFIKSRMMDWPNDPLTAAGYSFPAPGQVTTHGPVLYNGLGKLHFCGEHTCYKFVGYMEGGLNSGVSLAKRIAVRDGVAK